MEMLPLDKISIILIEWDRRLDIIWSFHCIGHDLVLILHLLSSICCCMIVYDLIVLNDCLLKVIQMLLVQDTFELLCFLLWALRMDHVIRTDDISKLPGISGILVLRYGP